MRGAGTEPAVCVLAALLSAVAIGLPPAQAGDRVLSYQIDVGDRLVYDRRETVVMLDGRAGCSEIRDRVEVWGLRRSGAQVAVLVTLGRSVDGQAAPLRAAVLMLDATGRRETSPEITARLGDVDAALDFLPLLPTGPQREDGWLTPPDHYGRQWRCAGRGPDETQAGAWRMEFALEDVLGVVDLLGQARRGRFWFDAAGGVVTRLESADEDRSAGTRSQVVGVLRERLKQSPSWCDRRAGEAAGFLRAIGREDGLLQELLSHPGGAARICVELDRLWAGFKSDVESRSMSPFDLVADGQRRYWRARVAALEARAALGARWWNRSAGAWTLPDAGGTAVPCETVRRGAVIECFWSSGLPAGLHVLDVARQLQAELPDYLAVRVLCYNVDRDTARAQQAIARCGSGLTHLLAWPLWEVETLPELPIVRVLDTAGIVRGIWIGWRPAYGAARDLAVQLAPRRSAPDDGRR